MRCKDFLSIKDFQPAEIRHLLQLAEQIKMHPGAYEGILKHQTLAMIFEKPSLRTRVTFDVGIHQLGGSAIYLSPAEINLGKRESVYDVAKNLERMVQGVMIRTFAHEIVEQFSRHARIPVINGLTDYSHPCQAMADYLTICEAKGHADGVKIAFFGEGNNVARSLAFAGAQLGAHVWVASPRSYELDAESLEWARERGRETGGRCTVTNDAREAASGAEVVYTDIWASMGHEAEAAERKAIFAPYQVNPALFRLAKPDAIFLHCLPAHRGQEVTDEVIDSPRSFVYQEAENRLHVQKAIMIALMKTEFVRLPESAEAESMHLELTHT
jgi:ornithine carbamoyltransferase